MSRDKWRLIRKELKNDHNYHYNIEWEKAIILFENRVKKRYFLPVQELIKLKEFKGEGFPIVTVQCALIETLAAFKKGMIHNPRFNEDKDPMYQYGNSSKLFTEFLLEESIFLNNFFKIENGERKLNSPYNAMDFYANVRCGLVHETRTKNKWVIRVKASYNDNIFIELDDKNGDKVIYRTKLQRQLEKYFDLYLSDLRDPQNNELRKFLGRKLDHIYEFKKKSKRGYGWWEKENNLESKCSQRLINYFRNFFCRN